MAYNEFTIEAHSESTDSALSNGQCQLIFTETTGLLPVEFIYIDETKSTIRIKSEQLTDATNSPFNLSI